MDIFKSYLIGSVSFSRGIAISEMFILMKRRFFRNTIKYDL